MKKAKTGKLIPALLVLAILLPCVLTVPASAAQSSGATEYYSWTPAGSRTTDMQALAYNVKTGQESGVYWYGDHTFYTTAGPKSGKVLAAITSTNRAPADGTTGVQFELAAMEDVTIGTQATVSLSVDYVLLATSPAPNSGTDDRMEIYVEFDGTYAETPVSLRSKVYQGGSAAGSHLYKLTSENLLTIAPEGAEAITGIKFKPYGDYVPTSGNWGIMGLQVESFAAEADFVSAYPADAGVSYLTVEEDILRDIVVAEALRTANMEWTAGEDILSLNPLGASDYATQIQVLLYKQGASVRGPIYSRYNASSREHLQQIYGTTYMRTDLNGDGEVNYLDTCGMHCATFVFNAISRISARNNAISCYSAVNNEKLTVLGSLSSEGKTLTSQIVTAATEAELYAAYDQLQPGDILNAYDAQGNVHIRIVSSVDKENRIVYCHEEGSTARYYDSDVAGGFTAVTGTVTNQTPSNNLPEGTTEADVVASLTQEYGTAMANADYVRSARVDNPYTYADLKGDYYAPYTLTDYAQEKVEQADVDIVIAGKRAGSDHANGINLGVSSNYRIICAELTLTDGAGTEIYSRTQWTDGNAYAMVFDSAVDEELTGYLGDCNDYTLTVEVTSGPVTTVNGTVPTTSKSVQLETVELTALPATLSSGKYVLSDDITAAAACTINGDVTLCLHGNTLTNGITTGTASSAKRLFTVSSGTLTICDCVGGGMIYSEDIDNTYAVYVGGGTSAAKVELKGGTIKGFKRTGGGTGGVFVGSNGTFDMYGGAIKDCVGKYGGAVYFYGGAMNQYGGEISGNTSSTSGGALFVDRGTFKMYGGTITGNAATTNGGGVYVSNTSGNRFEMRGGEISGNTAAGNGAGVYNAYVFNMYDGEISGNTATGNGGGVWSNTTQCYLYGGEISGNSAANGGGVYSSSKITMNDGTISGNVATTSGGGVYFSGANGFTMTDGAISGNRAARGGGIALYSSSSTFTMRGGLIGGDTLDQANILVGTDGAVYGSAIYVGTGTANLYGGDIAGNISDNTVTVTKGETQVTTANGNGAVWVSTGTVVLGADPDAATTYTGARIYGNKGRYTGGIWINGAGTFTMTGGSIGMDAEGQALNTVTSGSATAFYIYGSGAGAAISGGQVNGGFVNAGTLTVSGGKFSHSPAAYLADGYQIVEIDESGLNYSVTAG